MVSAEQVQVPLANAGPVQILKISARTVQATIVNTGQIPVHVGDAGDVRDIYSGS